MLALRNETPFTNKGFLNTYVKITKRSITTIIKPNIIDTNLKAGKRTTKKKL